MIVTTFDVLRAQYLLETRLAGKKLPGRPIWAEKPDADYPFRVSLDKLPVHFHIVADTEGAALETAAKLSAAPPEGWGWAFRVVEVTQHVEPDQG